MNNNLTSFIRKTFINRVWKIVSFIYLENFSVKLHHELYSKVVIKLNLGKVSTLFLFGLIFVLYLF